MVCQIADPTIYLPCTARESGGVRCERLEEHGDSHAISAHTIQHSLAGNGWACSAINPTESKES